MKRKPLSLLLLGMVLILLTACPYQSSVPIDNPVIKVKKELLGKWIKSSDTTKQNPDFFKIGKLTGKQYKIVKNEYKSYDSAYTETEYFSHLSKIENLYFLNMQKDGVGNYFLYRIDFGNGKFTLFEITDNIDEKFNTSADLKAFIKKYMHLSFFYNKDEEEYIKEN